MEESFPGAVVDPTERRIEIRADSPAELALAWVAEQYATVSRDLLAQVLFTVARLADRYQLVEERPHVPQRKWITLGQSVPSEYCKAFSERLTELDELYPLLVHISE